MDAVRRYLLTTSLIAVVAAAHALLTWPLQRTLVLFGAGMAIAAVLEAIGVALGLLVHEMRPQVAGVPLVVVAAWPGTVYLTYRLALLVAPAGWQAAALAALVGTAWDLATDPAGVSDGVWRYPDHPLSTPRYRQVPWWNFLAWFVIVFLTAMVPTFAGV
jgi:putative membrane protein